MIEIVPHESRCLAGNLPGDPTRRNLWVYLPPGYAESGLRYPVLWCLIGFTGSGEMAVTGNHWAPGLAARLDRLVAAGCPPVVVAFPDCFTRWGGSQYVDSPALGPYETYLCDELVPFLDGRYRTLPRREARGVFGKSSGGYGAIRLGMTRPDRFGALACHSGDMAFELCYAGEFPRTVAALAKAGSIENWMAEFEKSEKKRTADFPALNTFAMAAAYSPDPRSPFGFELPFDAATGERNPEVWARWLRHDPVAMLDRPECENSLRSLSLVYLDCGSDDEYQLHLGMRLLASKLARKGIPHEVEEFPDDHRSISYRYDVSVPKLARALERASRDR